MEYNKTNKTMIIFFYKLYYKCLEKLKIKNAIKRRVE